MKNYDLSAIERNNKIKGLCLKLRKSPLPNYWEKDFLQNIILDCDKANHNAQRLKLSSTRKEKFKEIVEKYRELV